MSASLAIQPIALHSLIGVSPLLLDSVTSATPPSSVSFLDSASSIVQLSALGQLLASGTALESRIAALQANTANATPSTVLATAQAFVAAFNNEQQNLASALALGATLPDNQLLAQFAKIMDAAATSSTAAGIENLSSLQSIGISLTASTSVSGTTTALLSIDQSALAAAVDANPEQTAALLAQATKPLLQQVTLFEVQATSASGLTSDASVVDIGLPTNLLQNLSADTVLNTIQLANLDLAAVGLDANTIQSTSSVLDTSLSANLAELIDTNSLTTLVDATPTRASLAPVSTATSTVPVSVATPETAAADATLSATATQNPALSATAAPVVAPLPTDQATSDATLALQNMMADSALRDIIFDPAYSVLIAAAHLIDFTAPIASIRQEAIPTSIPAAIPPLTRSKKIGSEQDAASAFVGR